MNHNDDFIGQLEDYLATFDGVTALPDRVRDAIRAELPSARQVGPRPGPERVFTMLSNASTGPRLGLAAAALVVAVVLGAAYLNNGNDASRVGGEATSTPSPTPAQTIAPTPAPSAAAQPLELGVAPPVPCAASDTSAGCLAPGTYRLTGAAGVWPAMVTVAVPAGWFEWFGGTGWDAVLVDKGRGASGWGVMFYTVGDVARDPCDSNKGSVPAAQVETPEKLADAMAAWPHFTATARQPITLDGHSGVTFRLTASNKSTCTGNGTAGQSKSGAIVDAWPMVRVNDPGTHGPVTVEIVDTGNGLLVIRATDFPQTSPFDVSSSGHSPDPTFHAGDQADLHAILDSIRLSVPPASS